MKRLALLCLLGACDGAPPPDSLGQVLIPVPAKVDFGLVPAGQTATVELALHNAGSVQLHLEAPIISQAGSGFSGVGFPVQLMPNETLSGQVHYDATTFGGHETGNLELFAKEFQDSLLVPLSADAGM